MVKLANLGDVDCFENARLNIASARLFHSNAEAATVAAVESFRLATQSSNAEAPLRNDCNLVIGRPDGTFSIRMVVRSLVGVVRLPYKVKLMLDLWRELRKLKVEGGRRNNGGTCGRFRLQLCYKKGAGLRSVKSRSG